MKALLAAVALTVVASAAAGFFTAKATAAAPVGLFAEQQTNVIGVKVARVVDTSNGTVCYVATRADSSSSAAISCLGKR